MESTKSNLVLRSMDMEGRPLSTERPSVFKGGSNAAGAQGGARADRFASVLASRAQAPGASGEIEAQFAARLREGRTDAASDTYRARADQENAWTPRNGGSADSMGDHGPVDTAADRPGEGHESHEGRQPRREGQPSPRPDGGADQAAQESTSQSVDAADAKGAETPDAPAQGNGPAAALLSAQPIGTAMAAPAQAASAVAAPAAMAFAAQPVGAQAAARAVTPIAPPTANAVNSAKAATKTGQVAQTKQSHTPEQAKAVLDQIRVQILDGKREARIQLRPLELGRLDLLIRVDGGAVTARIGVERPEALSVLEAHAPELRAWLGRDGAESVEVELYQMDAAADDGGAGRGQDGSSKASADGSSSDPKNHQSGARRSGTTTPDARGSAAGLGVPAGLRGGIDFVA